MSLEEYVYLYVKAMELYIVIVVVKINIKPELLVTDTKRVICGQAQTFSQVLETDEGSDEKAITAMGLLNTIETLLTVMEEQPEIMAQLQPTVLGVVGHIFTNSVMGEFLTVEQHAVIRSNANLLSGGRDNS